MSVIPKEKIGRLIERYETIQAELNQGAPQATYVRLTREFSELQPLIAAVRELAAKYKAESRYEITDTLFVYRDGRFVKFTGK